MLAGLEKMTKQEVALDKQASLGLGLSKRAIVMGGTILHRISWL